MALFEKLWYVTSQIVEVCAPEYWLSYCITRLISQVISVFMSLIVVHEKALCVNECCQALAVHFNTL